MRNITRTLIATLVAGSLTAAALIACSVEAEDDLVTTQAAIIAEPSFFDASVPTIGIHGLTCTCVNVGKFRCSGKLTGQFRGFVPTLEFGGRTLPLGPHEEFDFLVDHSDNLVASIGHEGFGAISSFYIAKQACQGVGGGWTNE
jgi:hypothetical protein